MILPAAMRHALDLAAAAGAQGEVPVGAVVVDPGGGIVAAAANRTLTDRDPSAHAEMLAVREACVRLGSERLVGHDIYVTLEPCAMCTAVISFARLRRLYFGVGDPKMGAVEHGPRFFMQPSCHHMPEVYGGIGEAEARALLVGFFQARR